MQLSLKFPVKQVPRWQKKLACAFTKPEALLRFLELDPQLLPESTKAGASKFGFKVTRSFASRIIKGDINDPLLRQVLPSSDELLNARGYSDDPVGDQGAIKSHKYHGRLLLISTGACRNVVKDRMEHSGMRWVMKGAHAMLSLRSIHLSGLWDEFIAPH